MGRLREHWDLALLAMAIVIGMPIVSWLVGVGLPFRRGGLAVGGVFTIDGKRISPEPEPPNLVHPRWVAKLWAKLFGYFWTPCPICKEPFAGFEWGASLYKGHGAGTGVCANPDCIAEANRRNEGFKLPERWR